ncbi:MAG TPA: hypothetical protein VF153_00195 [Candidatus Limnocylindria bacterium]
MAPRFAVAWLFAAGAMLCAGGVATIVIGTYFTAWIYSLLPPLVIDAAAVGGAATASGIALLALGVLHLTAGVLVGRGTGAVLTPAVVLAATMVLLCIGWGAAALTSAASGGGPPALLLPAGIGLGAVAVGYGLAARGLIGLRKPPGP